MSDGVNDVSAPRSASLPPYVGPPMAARPLSVRGTGIVLTSMGLHLLVLGLLGFMPSPADVLGKQTVEMDIIEPVPEPEPPPPPPPPPPPKEEPEPPPPPKVVAPKVAAPKPVPDQAPPEPPKEAPPAAAEAPVDFTGVTLTADGASWSSAVGSGAPLQGPVGRIAKVTGRDVAGTGTTVAPPAVVAEASLSRKPVPPPDMDALLEQNFPPGARAQGVSGTALLRVRIQSDGRPSDMQIVRETGDYGFGEACKKTLRMRRWQPPLDRTGNPVATDIKYSCEFEVGY